MICKTCSKQSKTPFICSECGEVDFKYQALRHLVFVLPEQMEQKIGSIYVPDKVWENYQFEYGIVLTSGKGYYNKKRKWVDNPYKPGDYIVFDRFVPWKVVVDGVEVKIMSMEDIKAYIKRVNMETFIPTSNQIFVKPITEEKKGSIFVLENHTNSLTGEVIAVGNKINDVKVGDNILFSNKGFNNFRSKEGQKFFIMDLDNVIAILGEKNETKDSDKI